MTFTSSFFKLVLEELKRRITEIIIVFLIIFITQPVFTFIDTMPFNMVKSNHDFYYHFSLVPFGNTIMMIFPILYGIISALCGFSYLFSRKKIDFYHSMPIRREKLFFIKYISGIIIFVIPYYVNSLAQGIIMWQRTGKPSSFGNDYEIYIFYFFIITYLFTVLAIMLAGNTVISIITSIGLSSYLLIIQIIINFNLHIFFVTYSNNSFNSSFFEKTSMFSYLMMMIKVFFRPYWLERLYSKIGLPHETIITYDFDIALLTVLFILITALSLILYIKRPLEITGKSFIFKWMERLLKYAVSLPCAFLLGILLFFSKTSFNMYAAGVFADAVMIPCILEIIFHHDIKKAFSHIIEMLIIVFIAVVLVFFIRYDWLKYNRYKPDMEDVESIGIDIHEYRYTTSFYEQLLDNDLLTLTDIDKYQPANIEIKNNLLT